MEWRVLVNNKYDEKEVASVEMEASKDVFTRTGVAGFPLLCGGFASTIINKRCQERGGESWSDDNPLSQRFNRKLQ